MKIAIQADGGSSIGMGHIMRTLVLAKELSKHNNVFYICRVENLGGDPEKSMKINVNEVTSIEQLMQYDLSCSKYFQGNEKVLSEGFKVILLNEDKLIDNLKFIKADLLITDSYSVNERYFKETKKIFNKTAYIDDINQHYFDVDFLINQNSDAEDFNYMVNSETKLLLGTDYLLLRDEFRNLPIKHIRSKVHDIMITVGGADAYHVTEKLLNYISELSYNFHIVIGPSFGDTSYIKNFINNNIKFYYNANMCEIMKSCDMAISACGSTLYELFACGVPTLGVIIADNQEGIANKLNDLGIIKNLGWYDKITKEVLNNHIDNLANNYILRKSISEKSTKIVDGKGSERIANILCENFKIEY